MYTMLVIQGYAVLKYEACFDCLSQIQSLITTEGTGRMKRQDILS